MNIRSVIRGASLFNRGRAVLRSLTPNQPLLLVREPTNPVDPNAVIVRTLMGEESGYVAREHAARIAPDMDRGIMWMAKVLGRPRILLWRDPPRAREVEEKRERRRTRRLVKEFELVKLDEDYNK
jgi:hypothetical protein